MAELDPWGRPAGPDYDGLEQQHGLPKGLLNALKATERSGKDAVSPKGARGVFQFMPATAKAYGLEDPTDEAASADAAARYMADAMKRYGTSDPRVLAAEYNGGPTQAKAVLAGKAPPAAETQKYIANVASILGVGDAQASPVEAQRDPWEQAAGAAATPKKAPAVPEGESPTSFGNLVGAALEPMLAMASGAIAQPLAGISGLGAAALGAAGMTGMDGAKQVEKVQNALTYQPRTEGGKNAMKVISYPFEKLSEVAEAAGQKTLDLTGSPGLAAQVETAGKFAPAMLGAKAIKGNMPASTPAALSAPVQELVSRGIRLTPGELLGGGFGRAEQALSSFPVVGGFVKDARNRSLRDFTNATVSDALEPVGVKLPDGLQGHGSVAWARNKLGEMYDETLGQATGRLGPQEATAAGTPGVPALPGAAATPSLQADLNGVLNLARSSKMPRQYVNELDRIVQQEVVDRFQFGGVTSGETVKAMQNNLNGLIKKKINSENFDVRQQAAALTEVKNSLGRMMQRENPDLAGALADIDSAYGKFKIVQKAASAAGSDSGVFTPAQFMSAVRAKDITKDKRAFSEGSARSQSLAEAGKDVLSPTLADSGTPTRLLTAELLGGGLAGHFAGLPGLGAALAIPAAYSAPGVAVLQKLLTSPRPTGSAANVLYGLLNPPENQARR